MTPNQAFDQWVQRTGAYRDQSFSDRRKLRAAFDAGVAHGASSRTPAAKAAWQPMETAPKDGTRVVGIHDAWAVLMLYDGWHWINHGQVINPTGWMPLPSP